MGVWLLLRLSSLKKKEEVEVFLFLLKAKKHIEEEKERKRRRLSEGEICFCFSLSLNASTWPAPWARCSLAPFLASSAASPAEQAARERAIAKKEKARRARAATTSSALRRIGVIKAESCLSTSARATARSVTPPWPSSAVSRASGSRNTGKEESKEEGTKQLV